LMMILNYGEHVKPLYTIVARVKFLSMVPELPAKFGRMQSTVLRKLTLATVVLDVPAPKVS
jgi:hypothetical protein